MIKLRGLVAEGLNGFMDEGTEFLGELRFRDTLRIDGHLKGKIVSDNTLIVGESGHVEADIDCGVVSIRGTVHGPCPWAPEDRAPGGLQGPGHPRLPQARDRGRSLLPGGLRDGPRWPRPPPYPEGPAYYIKYYARQSGREGPRVTDDRQRILRLTERVACAG